MSTALAIVDDCIPPAVTLNLCCKAQEIPVQEFHEFMSLAREQREIITLNLEAMAYISKATTIKAGCSEVSRVAACLYPNVNGFSPSSLRRKYDVWTNGGFKTKTDGSITGPRYDAGDWHYFIPAYNNGADKLPPEFVDYLVTAYAKTTRENDSFAGIHRRLKLDWLNDIPIPGYGTATQWYQTHMCPRPRGAFIRDKDLPNGWSQRNIGRIIQKALPRKQLRRAAQGQLNRVATNWATQLLRDRSQLLPFQLTTIDDVRLDLQCRMYLEEKWQIVYLDAIFHLDVATGYILGYGIKGRATRSDTTEMGRASGTKMAINSNDVRHLLLQGFDQYGLPPFECYLLCENATARLSGADEIAFLSLLKNFHIDYSGMGRGKLLASGFHEEWGRPGVKGWIESWFRLLHTSINHLHGTTGRRYELTRADHQARAKHTLSLISRAEKIINGPLTPEHPLSKQINFPLLTVDEANQIIGEIVDALNWRIDHKLQGFARVFEFKDPSGLWLPENALNKLSPDERLGVKLTPRMESPAERFRRLITPYVGQFQNLDPITKSVLYLEKREVTVSNGKCVLDDQRISSDRMVFLADDPSLFQAYEGRKGALLAYISDDFSHAICSDVATGRHVGTLLRQGRVNVLDFDALGKAAGAVRRDMESELAVVRSYLTEEESRLKQINAHNEAILTPESVPAEYNRIKQHRTKTRAISHANLDASALLDDDDADRDVPAPYTTAPSFNGEDLL